ncbi:4Fe-4S dicluster domain-containing protein [Seongchinamella sediminis]|uniref:4Fe-4S dicluster domain-containing protein n=1 Tax=Seongchinamella sediminis TaxID=2283635 RepID=A0A3L7DU34_9GAMM|nr:(Fe-S)-binding protein [Seongchinamella sediminis]RLQ21088.1 4Fe-4S dicluster domain-containing protein [Seongchinamella sediminis]
MDTIPTYNYFILAAILLGALYSLFLGLRNHKQRVEQGRPWFGEKVTLEGARARFNIGSFIRRGLMTSRLKKRPVAGSFHGIMFIGALLLIFGHAVFMFDFVGIPVYEGWFGFIFLKLGRELGGIMLFTGVAFFLARRLAAPDRLTAGDKTRSGFERGEIFLLLIVIAGFLAEGFRLALEVPADNAEFLGQAIGSTLHSTFGEEGALLGMNVMWWVHGLMGCAFIAIIAHSPFSHMLLGPANSAFVPARDGINLPPINFDFDEDEDEDDEDEMRFGAAKLADLTQKNLLDASACLWCGRCHEVCPAAQTGKDLSPKKVMATCAEFIEQGKFDDDSLIDVLGQDAIFACTTCAACVEECPVSNNPAEVILEFRRHFVMDRSEMPETMAAANRNLESREHPFVGTGSNPEDWRKGLDVPFFAPGETEYLLWIGCSVTYEERAQEIARAMVKILEAAGVSYGIFEEPRCTGDPAKMMGNEMQFVEIAETNIEEFKEQKIQKVITMCAHCYNSFDRYYPELGADWQTIPHTVFIEELQAQGKLVLAEKSDETITFHDPCYLARHNGIVDAPRNVIASVGKLIEMPRSKKDSFCCGAGGGNYWGGQGGTARVSDVRMQEAFDTGADKVATACSFCNLMLTSSSSKHTGERRVFDVAELVAEKITIIED